jgi:hypothetical protein
MTRSRRLCASGRQRTAYTPPGVCFCSKRKHQFYVDIPWRLVQTAALQKPASHRVSRWSMHVVDTPESRLANLQTSPVKTRSKSSIRFEVTELPHVSNALAPQHPTHSWWNAMVCSDRVAAMHLSAIVQTDELTGESFGAALLSSIPWSDGSP